MGNRLDGNCLSRKVLADAKVADHAGTYGSEAPFTGIIDWKGNKGRVSSAVFTLNKNGSVSWTSGEWIKGYWKRGTWLGGTWSGGTWAGGSWKGGIWKGGEWIDGRIFGFRYEFKSDFKMSSIKGSPYFKYNEKVANEIFLRNRNADVYCHYTNDIRAMSPDNYMKKMKGDGVMDVLRKNSFFEIRFHGNYIYIEIFSPEYLRSVKNRKACDMGTYVNGVCEERSTVMRKRKAGSNIQNYIEALEGLVEENSNKVEKSDDEVVKMLVVALADEFLSWYQYWVCMNLSRGAGKYDADPEFEEHANEEMEHANLLMQRIKELGGKPIFNPNEWLAIGHQWQEVNTGSVAKQLEITIGAEKIAIDYYRQIIDYVRGYDETTLRVVRGILADEEKHLYDLSMVLESVNG